MLQKTYDLGSYINIAENCQTKLGKTTNPEQPKFTAVAATNLEKIKTPPITNDDQEEEESNNIERVQPTSAEGNLVQK